jgi:MoaA/NifB/PqqE/SkfB family radical SAM enzyme
MHPRVDYHLRKLNAIYHPTRMMVSPKWLVLGVNNSCNLHCKMCDVGVSYSQSNFYQNLMGSQPVHMPMDLFRKIADEAAMYYPGIKLGYAFTEPLIYTHLEESLHYAREKKLYTSITTNALGLKKWAPKLEAADLRELFISVDGPEAIHNEIRGNQHSYGRIIEGIEVLGSIKSKIRTSVFCVITEWNIGRIIELLDDLDRFPIAHVGLMHPNFTPQSLADTHNDVFGGLYPATASNVSHTHNESIDLKALWKELSEIKERKYGFTVGIMPELTTYEALSEYYMRPDRPVGKRCMDIFSNLMIKSNGDVIPAHGRCYNIAVGNLHSSDLKSIWNSAVLAKFRKTVTEAGGLLPACTRCCSAFSS